MVCIDYLIQIARTSLKTIFSKKKKNSQILKHYLTKRIEEKTFSQDKKNLNA